LAKDESIVLSLPDGNEIYSEEGKELKNDGVLSKIRVGDPLGTLYGLRFLGVYSTSDDPFVRNPDGSFVYDLNDEKIPIRWNTENGYIFKAGDAIYEDVNGDGVINMSDVVKIGNSRPKLAGGFNLQLGYKDFSLMTQFNFRYKFDVFNQTKMRGTSMYNENNQTTAVMRRWRKEGDITDIPRALYGMGYNWVCSDRYVEDASFIRLSTIMLSYRAPSGFVQKIGFKNLSVNLTCSNLFLLTKYSGVDPEVTTGSNKNPFLAGIDVALTPKPVRYAMGIVLDF